MSEKFDLEKRAVELGGVGGWLSVGEAMALAREYVDARAEEIAQAIEEKAIARHRQAHFTAYEGQRNALVEECAKAARSFISKPEPRTREQVLEEALREISEGRFRTLHDAEDEYTVKAIARRALDAK